MKVLFSLLACLLFLLSLSGQTKKIEINDLFKVLIPDSTENQSGSDWNLKMPDAQTIKWTSDQLEMSDDMSINFFKKALVIVSIKGVNNNPDNQKWNLMLRGPRMGFTNFNLTSPFISGFNKQPTLDSIFSLHNYKVTLLETCDATSGHGFQWYKIIFPKKIISYLKLGWEQRNDTYKLSIDCYDSWSMQYAHLECN